MIKDRTLQVAVLLLFTLGFCVGLFGLFQQPANIGSFISVLLISTFGIAFVGPWKLESFSLLGMRAELGKVNETLNQLVMYSLSEVIYRELLWKIGHNEEVKCDQTADQQRWLNLLFDHGLLDARDWDDFKTKFGSFGNIPVDHNLSAIFKATPAANWLMDMRGKPVQRGG